jgi:Domain of unknown function (DUF5642)
MVLSRRLAALLTVLCAAVALSGCSAAKTEPESAPTSAEAAAEYDLARLAVMHDDFPPGFIPFPFELRKLQPTYVDQVSAAVSYGRPFTVDPPQCKSLLKPVDGQAGADSNGSRADGPDKQSISVAADMPVSIPAEIPATGCNRMTYTVQDDRHPSNGTAERITAPSIGGATTFALKIVVDGFPQPEYFYAAILDERVFVDVNARLNPGVQADPLLSDLLVKAVAAIRG